MIYLFFEIDVGFLANLFKDLVLQPRIKMLPRLAGMKKSRATARYRMIRMSVSLGLGFCYLFIAPAGAKGYKLLELGLYVAMLTSIVTMMPTTNPGTAS